jgi:hypothetical protein
MQSKISTTYASIMLILFWDDGTMLNWAVVPMFQKPLLPPSSRKSDYLMAVTDTHRTQPLSVHQALANMNAENKQSTITFILGSGWR